MDKKPNELTVKLPRAKQKALRDAAKELGYRGGKDNTGPNGNIRKLMLAIANGHVTISAKKK